MFHKKQNQSQQPFDPKATCANTACTDGSNTAAPGTKDTIYHSTAVKEVVKPTTVEEIQPVVHRQIETTEIHQVTQPIYERNVLPTQVQDRVLPATVKPDVYIGQPAQPMPAQASSRVVESASRSTVVKPAIVEETIRPHIIEEIQPVVFRETVAPTVVREVQPINERIIQQPVVIQETRQPISSMGSSGFTPVTNAAPQVSSNETTHHSGGLKEKLHNIFHKHDAQSSSTVTTTTTTKPTM